MWIHKFDPLKVDDLFDADAAKPSQVMPTEKQLHKIELFDPSRSTALPQSTRAFGPHKKPSILL